MRNKITSFSISGTELQTLNQEMGLGLSNAQLKLVAAACEGISSEYEFIAKLPESETAPVREHIAPDSNPHNAWT